MLQSFYIVILGYTFQTNNDLEKAVSDLLVQENRRVIPAKDVPDYQEQLLEQIRLLNMEHHHLPPVDADFWNPGVPCLPNDSALRFTVNNKNTMLCSFTLYSSK